MTQIDLRIKYKSETGMAPTYGRYGEDDQLQLIPFISVSSCNYQSNRGLTHEYAEWLERDVRKRNAFKRDIAEYGTYYDKYRKLRYTREYKDWMEYIEKGFEKLNSGGIFYVHAYFNGKDDDIKNSFKKIGFDIINSGNEGECRIVILKKP